jgi:transcriptional regulator of arginine metabolism
MAPVSGGVAGPGNGGARDAGRLSRVMRDSVLSIETAASQVVIKTPPAEAQTVGRILDQAGIEEVVGTIAGDDTIFLAAGGVDAAVRIRDRLLAMAGMQGRDSSSRTR